MADDKGADSSVKPFPEWEETISLSEIGERFLKHIILGYSEEGWYVMLGGSKVGLSYRDLADAWAYYTDFLMQEGRRIIGSDVDKMAEVANGFQKRLGHSIRLNMVSLDLPEEENDA